MPQCWINSDGGLAAIGTLLRIERHSRLPDGRLAVDNLGARCSRHCCGRCSKQKSCHHQTVHVAAAGVQRFRVLRVIEQAPVLMCEVELLEDEDDTSEEARHPSAADLWLPCVYSFCIKCAAVWYSLLGPGSCRSHPTVARGCMRAPGARDLTRPGTTGCRCGRLRLRWQGRSANCCS